MVPVFFFAHAILLLHHSYIFGDPDCPLMVVNPLQHRTLLLMSLSVALSKRADDIRKGLRTKVVGRTRPPPKAPFHLTKGTLVMSHDRYDPELYRLRRVPSPQQLCHWYAYPNTTAMIVPLSNDNGVAVVLIGYHPGYSAIPVAHYDRTGALHPLPTSGLVESSRKDLPFPYEIQADRALRTARDPRDLGEQWVRERLDTPPRQRC